MLETMDTIDNLDLREELIIRVDVLERVKSLLLLPDTEYMTTKMAADYYEVGESRIRQVAKEHFEEIQIDGYKVVKRKEVYCLLGRLTNKIESKTGYSLVTFNDGTELKVGGVGIGIFTKRAVLRVGMLLRDSEIAKEVRTQLLNMVEKVEDEVKIEDIVSEQELALELGKAYMSGDFNILAEATMKFNAFTKRRELEQEQEMNKKDEEIKRKEKEINVLVGEKLGLGRGDTLRKIVRVVSYSLKDSLDKHISFYYNEIYHRLSDKYDINLWQRRGKSNKPLQNFIKEEEWPTVFSVATAVAKYYSVDISHIILE